MTLLKCATHIVGDVDAAVARYSQWLDYTVVEDGVIPADLAAAWNAPASAGRRYVLMQPSSGSPVFLRFIEGDDVPDYRPIRTYGWAAIEICVSDVEIVNERMIASKVFDVIGAPKPLDGFPNVKPMQVRGPDQETVYLTEIRVDDPSSGLPQVKSLVDRPFILVLACPDLRATAKWMADVLGLEVIDPVAIRYSMISLAFDLPAESKHELVTAKWQGQVFLEADQYPEGTTVRPAHPGALPPGVSIVSMVHPDLARLEGHWASPPVSRDGALYAGARVGLLKTPEGALLEVIEGDPIAWGN
ncbi:VOC family protein [Sphingobium boeckii]|uniref:Catechol 2,3-dioxygenase-like lactoylglutathione lyase family enzyme n=1 Tax=Sphingobium boeckii TaxID=1082345 RepID=A0A7W9AL59_9SPHN|nr:VOC family protein [Sphingobium boeckii]MBB5687690.1 catechol 2,3-dioxygenase-like lactoylglutathione lyase family enzyme [Sphingobium boeckii]